MELRKFLEPSGLNQPSIRHDTESLEMRGPILAEVDVLDITALCYGTVQCVVIDTEIFLIEFRREFDRQCPVKHHCRHFFERNPSRLRQLFRIGKLHKIQCPSLFRNGSCWIDPTDKQSPRQNS